LFSDDLRKITCCHVFIDLEEDYINTFQDKYLTEN
jgi:hypothetical protein